MNPGTHCIGGCVGLSTVLDVWSLSKIEQRIVQPTATILTELPFNVILLIFMLQQGNFGFLQEVEISSTSLLDCQRTHRLSVPAGHNEQRVSVRAQRHYHSTTTHRLCPTNPHRPHSRRQYAADRTTWIAKPGSSKIYSTLVQQCASVGKTRKALWRAGGAEELFNLLTLRLLMSYIYIYGAPSKARNANVVYIWTYVWQR